MSNQNYSYYTITSIGNLIGDNKALYLPKMQRGFVWKPSQMGYLWDSILRGFPLGAILVATNNDQSKKELLDGQQRITTIASGFYNPFDSEVNSGIFAIKEFPVLWIEAKSDAIKPSENEFGIYVLTKSHPWGYQALHPEKRLEAKDIHLALEYFRTKQSCSNFLDIKQTNINPWDANCPIPLAFVLSLCDNTYEDFEKKFRLKIKGLKVQTKHSGGVDISYEKVLLDVDLKRLYKASQLFQKIIIPELLIDLDNVDVGEQADIDEKVQDPTLFLRLNRGGTQIDGEELVYSMYKSKFPHIKDAIEAIEMAKFIPPSRLVNVISRLAEFKTDLYKGNDVSYKPTLNLSRFKNLLDNEEFKNKLLELVDFSKNGSVSKQFDILTNIFSKNSLQGGVPLSFLKSIFAQNIDLVFIYLSLFEKLRLSDLDDLRDVNKQYLAGLFMYLSYFADNKSSSNVKRKLYTRFFNLLLKEQDLTVVNLIDRCNSKLSVLIEEQLLLPVVSGESILKIYAQLGYCQYSIFSNTEKALENLRLIDVEEPFLKGFPVENSELLKKIIGRINIIREFILIAQRDYITKEFEAFNQYFSIEDMNRPWDWDHIYPNSFVYNKNDIMLIVKELVNSIGNLRALSFAENRSQNNNYTPKERLDETMGEARRDCFISDDDYNNYWSNLDNYATRLTSNVEKHVLGYYLNAILSRTANIYNLVYQEFFINIKP